MMRWLFVPCVIAAGLLFVGPGINLDAEEGVQRTPYEVTDEASAPDPALFMQAKLSVSQRVLAGLLNEDFKDVKAAAQVLVKLAESATIRNNEQPHDRIYEHFRTEFIRLSARLEMMADQQNLEGAAYVHQHMTATCIACHQHLRDGRTVSAPTKRTPESAAKPSPDKQ